MSSRRPTGRGSSSGRSGPQSRGQSAASAARRRQAQGPQPTGKDQPKTGRIQPNSSNPQANSGRPTGRPAGGDDGRPGTSRPDNDASGLLDRLKAAGNARRPGAKADKAEADSASGGARRPVVDRAANQRGMASSSNLGGTARTGSARSGATSSGTRPGQTSSEPTNRAPRKKRDFTKRREIVYAGKNKTHRISGQMLVIFIVAVFSLGVLWRPTMTYLDQQEQMRDLQASLIKAQERVKDLEHDLALWNDPAYIATQARERLGYVKPGQTLYIVTDPEKGSASEVLDEKIAAVNKERRESTPFYVTMWDSVSIAGQVGDVENPSDVPIIEQPDQTTPSATPSGEPSGTPSGSATPTDAATDAPSAN